MFKKIIITIIFLIFVIAFSSCNQLDGDVITTSPSFDSDKIQETLHETQNDTFVVQTTEQVESIYEESDVDYCIIFKSLNEFRSFLNSNTSNDILNELKPNQNDSYYSIMLELVETLSKYNVYSFESNVAKIQSIKVEKKMVPDFIKWFDCSYEFEYNYSESISPVKVAVYIPISQHEEILSNKGLTAYYNEFSNVGVPGNFDAEFYRNIENITVTIEGKKYNGLYVDVLSNEKSDFIEIAYENLMIRFELFGDRTTMPLEENIQFIESFYATLIQ